jgi:hypothetical protein
VPPNQNYIKKPQLLRESTHNYIVVAMTLKCELISRLLF